MGRCSSGMLARPRFPASGKMDGDAGQVFRDIGMPGVAEFEPRTLEELADSKRAGQLWVAADEGDTPASFLMAVLLDGCLHVEQLSTDPARARRGLGRALLDHAARPYSLTKIARV
jgi:ribosomal protein S18 acetylase RimI-like enzyme